MKTFLSRRRFAVLAILVVALITSNVQGQSDTTSATGNDPHSAVCPDPGTEPLRFSSDLRERIAHLEGRTDSMASAIDREVDLMENSLYAIQMILVTASAVLTLGLGLISFVGLRSIRRQVEATISTQVDARVEQQLADWDEKHAQLLETVEEIRKRV